MIFFAHELNGFMEKPIDFRSHLLPLVLHRKLFTGIILFDEILKIFVFIAVLLTILLAAPILW